MFTFYLRYPANRSPGLCARGGFRVLLVVLMDSVANDGDPGNGSGDDCKPLRGRARLPVANDLPAHAFTNNRGLLRPYRCRSLPQRKTKSFPYCLQTIVVLPGCAGLLGWRCRTGRRGLGVRVGRRGGFYGFLGGFGGFADDCGGCVYGFWQRLLARGLWRLLRLSRRL